MAKRLVKSVLDEGFSMKKVIFGFMIMAMITILSCGPPMRRPDTDVTSSPEYNFKSFAGTVWKTKVEVALADLEQYTRKHDLNLLIPMHFDPTHPKYTPAHDMQIIAVLPVGTRVRIDRLIKDNGEWGGVRVAAKLEDRTYSEETVFLEDMLLAKNQF